MNRYFLILLIIRNTAMKKAMIVMICGLMAMTNIAYARSKQVAVCTSYFVGATAEMTCSGSFKGKATILQLYQAGWRYAGDIGGTNKFVLIFEK
jgi:hypothetical protein